MDGAQVFELMFEHILSCLLLEWLRHVGGQLLGCGRTVQRCYLESGGERILVAVAVIQLSSEIIPGG